MANYKVAFVPHLKDQSKATAVLASCRQPPHISVLRFSPLQLDRPPPPVLASRNLGLQLFTTTAASVHQAEQ